MSQAVLITGASGGIGQALVKAIAGKGYTVYAGVRGEAEVLAGMPGVRTVTLDVTDSDSVAAAAEQVGRDLRDQGLRAVINNAGVIVQGPLEIVPPAELRRQFEVNTYGPVFVTQAFLPLLRTGGGRVINISAATARQPVPFLAPLAGSKAALASMSTALRMELAAWDIPVVLIEPGSTATAIFDKAATAAEAALALADPGRAALYAEHLAAVAKATARRRHASTEPVVRTVTTALEARKPKRVYVVPGDARLLGLLSRLPAPLRERLISGTLGLTGVQAGKSTPSNGSLSTTRDRSR
ncbi:SDR family NAD(P)-dependent oxidoreductase [Nonomuraea jabiensis]|uniref:NAD(P)-dependent dehydrogenase (Short-subunit alcohol dehydrogenase family) n=1 Tax=Nonomuraea jabiensis TaxID=882448 RepID=A0A7W9LBK0_9ACTN|nr:SDR family NAD(P)-dependent oxidoreductase [Nonomuraea jabiensis]MBB5777822.1 NAD(P)-dependent dehydrogenase (short-subunit alcohol dehydrogenase family) [Nonomuraea jabiensis]